MDSTVPLCNSVSVAVTVASDKEPVECDGSFSAHPCGFTLEFYINRDKFTIEHSSESTRVVACGDMSYDINISDKKDTTLLSTPYGAVRFDVTPLERDVAVTESNVKIRLKYILSADGVGEMERSVEVTARFLQ